MISIVLSVVLAQSVTYQERVFIPPAFVEAGPDPAELLAGELACIASALPSIHPAENEADFLGVTYARQDTDRSRACVTWTVERSEPVEQFATRTRDTIPAGVRFAPDGSMAYWHEKLPRVCLPIGQFAGLRSCLADARFGVTMIGRVTRFGVTRPDTWSPSRVGVVLQTQTTPAAQYGAARANGRALSHVLEEPPPPGPELP